jgi:hypothetical protein
MTTANRTNAKLIVGPRSMFSNGKKKLSLAKVARALKNNKISGSRIHH